MKYRGPGEYENTPVRIDFFTKYLYSKAIGLRHVGPHALDRDLSEVFKNMCFDPKKLFAAVCGAHKLKKETVHFCQPSPNLTLIVLVQVNLSAKSQRRDLNK